jgi:tripartite-type tricarboxylate transporter receptor subunit TctC
MSNRLLAALLLAAAPFAAVAQTYPVKPIKLIIPFPPGGTTDIVGRIVAPAIGQQLGQPIVIENRGGGAGSIGAAEVAKSAPDGYTLGMSTVSTMGTNPATNSKLPYATTDFAAITNLAATPNVVAVHPSVPAQNMGEFLKVLKDRPGKLSYASSGTGGISHMMGELFKVTTKTFIVHIPYRGAGPMLNDAIGGQVEIVFDNLPSSLPHIQSGKLRALAVAAPKRVDMLPNVPTFAELGLAPVNDMAWYGLVAPAKAPADVIQRVHAAAVKALAQPEVQERLRQQGAIPVGNTPAEYKKQMDDELAKWKRVAVQQSIKLDQ